MVLNLNSGMIKGGDPPPNTPTILLTRDRVLVTGSQGIIVSVQVIILESRT